MKRGYTPRSDSGGGCPLVADQIREIDMKLELLKRERLLIEQQQQMLSNKTHDAQPFHPSQPQCDPNVAPENQNFDQQNTINSGSFNNTPPMGNKPFNNAEPSKPQHVPTPDKPNRTGPKNPKIAKHKNKNKNKKKALKRTPVERAVEMLFKEVSKQFSSSFPTFFSNKYIGNVIKKDIRLRIRKILSGNSAPPPPAEILQLYRAKFPEKTDRNLVHNISQKKEFKEQKERKDALNFYEVYFTGDN